MHMTPALKQMLLDNNVFFYQNLVATTGVSDLPFAGVATGQKT